MDSRIMVITLSALWGITLVLTIVGIRGLQGRAYTRRQLARYAKLASGSRTQEKSSLRGKTSMAGQVRRQQLAAALKLRASEYGVLRILSVVIPMAIGYWVRGLLGGAFLGVAGYTMTLALIRMKERKWLADAETALPEFLSGVASAMRAGSSFAQSMLVVAEETPDPLGFEVKRVMRRESLGLTLDEALAELAIRIPSRDLGIAVTAIAIQREIGGALASILENISGTIAERQRLKKEVRTLTAQGRASGNILALLPMGIGLMIWFVNPSYIALLYTTKTGWIMLGYAAVSLIAGYTVIQRMVRGPKI